MRLSRSKRDAGSPKAILSAPGRPASRRSRSCTALGVRIDVHTHSALRFNAPSLSAIDSNASDRARDFEKITRRPEPIDHVERAEPLHDDGPIPFGKYLKRINRETTRLIGHPALGASSLETTAPHSDQEKPAVHNVVSKQTLSTPPAPFERVYVPVPIRFTGNLIDVLV